MNTLSQYLTTSPTFETIKKLGHRVSTTPVLLIIFSFICLALLLTEHYIITIIFSFLFTMFVTVWKLKIQPADFRKVIEIRSSQNQNTSNNNDSNEQQPNINNITMSRHRLSNMDRLRMLLSENDFDPNDFSFLNALDQDNNDSFVKGLTFDEMNSIPTKILHKTLNETCTICLLALGKNQEIRILPCKHQYHTECIDIWLNRRSHCPMCKTQAVFRPSSVPV